MAEVLVLVEHADGALKKVTAELITAARALGEPSAVVVGKPGTAGAAGRRAEGGRRRQDLRRRVRRRGELPDHPVRGRAGLAGRVGQPRRACCWPPAPTARRSRAGWPPASAPACWSTSSRSRRAAVGVHTIFGGAFTVEAKATGDTPVITVRPGAIEAEPAAGAGEVVNVEVPAQAENATKITKREPAVGRRPSRAHRGHRRRLRWPWRRQRRELQRRRGTGRLARCRRRRVACRGRLRLLPGPVPGGPDR